MRTFLITVPKRHCLLRLGNELHQITYAGENPSDVTAYRFKGPFSCEFDQPNPLAHVWRER